jgi:hypothetical protein
MVPELYVPGVFYPEMSDSLFDPAIDGPTLRSVEDLHQYWEWRDLCHAGS